MAKKYIDADKLKAEIERRKEEYKKDRYMSDYRGQIAYYKDEIYDDLLSFIDSLQQEQPCEDLEEEIKRYIPRDQCPVPDLMEAVARHFAEWQKEQMLKDAVEMTVGQIEKTMAGNTFFIHGFEVTEMDFPFINSQECGYGDKVKIVIIPDKEG